MKKYKLIKSVVLSAPVLVTPLIANSCSSKNNDSNKKPTAKYYVDALAKTLKAELNKISGQVVLASGNSNMLDITSDINAAKTNAKKIAKNMPNNIDNIALAFNGTSNLKVEKNSENKYILMVYPSFINSNSAEQTLMVTLSLTFQGKKNTQTITNGYDIPKGFKNYSMGLASQSVNSVYPSSDGNTIYAGTDAGVSVGTKSNNNYTFKNYTKGLTNNNIQSIYASSDGNTIYVGTGDNKGAGGVAVGTKSNDTYTFKNYTDGLGSDTVDAIDVTNNGSTIYAATTGGVSVGTKNSETYKFTNYTTKDGLASNTVFSVSASSDGNTIYAGTEKGLAVGTKSNDTYTFKNFTEGLTSNEVQSIYVSSDGNTIYAGTTSGVGVGTKSNNKYTFQTYTSGLGDDYVNSIYVSSDGNTIYAGTFGGVSIGTKQKDGSYTFQNYINGLESANIYSIYPSSDGNSIYVGTNGGGIGLSSSIWFTQSSLNNLTNDYQATALNYKSND